MAKISYNAQVKSQKLNSFAKVWRCSLCSAEFKNAGLLTKHTNECKAGMKAHNDLAKKLGFCP